MMPVDNEPPCPPEISITPDCERIDNILGWTFSNPLCSNDIAKLYIYFRPPLSTDFILLDSVLSIQNEEYIHDLQTSITGCYYMKTIDSTGNMSIPGDTLCIDSDTCGGYRLPNIFTPNQDTYNDYFIPYPFSSVEKIDLQIFNRWGNLIFKTDDPQINWDGKIQGTNQPASDGVYYYICDVFEIKLEGIMKRTLKGTITILR